MLLSFVIPCYNSAAFLDRGVNSLVEGVRKYRLEAGSDAAGGDAIGGDATGSDATGADAAGEDAEIIIVDDGSTDGTLALARQWQAKQPGLVRVIHQENEGHGGAINTGVQAAAGVFLKIVDSDDWLDEEALQTVLRKLEELHTAGEDPDLVFANYVYEHISDGTSRVVEYRDQFPQGRIFSWKETGRFPKWKFLMMHSFICRTQLLRENRIRLPEHMSYDDEVFVYETLPKAERLFYLDCDLYRYVTGRPGQSVGSAQMSRHADDQVRVCMLRIDQVPLPDAHIDKKLEKYLIQDLAFSMVFATLTCTMAGDRQHADANRALWRHLKTVNPKLWSRIRHGFFGFWSFLPGRLGGKMMLDGYHLASYVFKLN
jgi:glycosyltransferase involved in cell wall biosynthesis